MKCPKCYGKIDKVSKRCRSCGFNLKTFNGATHSAVKRARKEGFGEDVLYTADLPIDISKKKLLLLCIFLGIFGAHNYYVGRFFKAIYSTVVAVGCFAISAIHLIYLGIENVFGLAGTWVLSSFSLLMGINLVMFVFDLAAIIRNKYKVPVYKDEFSK